MKIVIDIPDKIYNDLRSRREANVADINIVFGAISGGTVIPQEHGELKDANALIDTLQTRYDFYLKAWDGSTICMPTEQKARLDEIHNCIAEVVNAPTILRNSAK